MATLDEVLVTLRAMDGYKWDRKRTEDHNGAVKLYTFWFTRDSDNPDDIRDYAVRILVINEGEANENAIVYSVKGIEQVSHAFRDVLKIAVDAFLTANSEYEKAVIESVNEENEYGDGRAVKTPDGVTTIVNWVGFIKEGETEVTLRILL